MTEIQSDYELIDFGMGRKLERFGPLILDRPCPAADGIRRGDASAWPQADWVFHTEPARWVRAGGEKGRRSSRVAGLSDQCDDDSWPVTWGDLRLELRRGSRGQVGVFFEQAVNWWWLFERVRRAGRPLRVLNLFAYTGASTLAAALAGAEVVHVDAARAAVEHARRNAVLSELDSRPIRWIVEDSRRFVARELRRGNQYDAVILDPPSYGHGPSGQAWKLPRDLPDLLNQCGELTEANRTFLLLTSHTPGYGPAELEALLADCVFGSCQQGARAFTLSLESADGRRLPSGVAARWDSASAERTKPAR